MLIALDNDTIARIGECPEGEFVVNTTTGGVECQAPITSITHYLNASDVTGGSYTDTEDVTDAWYYDSASLNFTEGSGTDPLDIYLNIQELRISMNLLLENIIWVHHHIMYKYKYGIIMNLNGKIILNL